MYYGGGEALGVQMASGLLLNLLWCGLNLVCDASGYI